MTLTPEQKKAGREFRDARQAVLDNLNQDSPPGEAVLVFWRVPRHECPASRPPGASTGVTLREHRDLSPDGLFAWIWKDGHCTGCRLILRTKTGRVIIRTGQITD